jgi:hypothetical protein
MQEKTPSITVSGSPICGLLGVVFVTLKLCGVIHWSWWFVTAPLWAPFALAVPFLILWLILWAPMRNDKR